MQVFFFPAEKRKSARGCQNGHGPACSCPFFSLQKKRKCKVPKEKKRASAQKKEKAGIVCCAAVSRVRGFNSLSPLCPFLSSQERKVRGAQKKEKAVWLLSAFSPRFFSLGFLWFLARTQLPQFRGKVFPQPFSDPVRAVADVSCERLPLCFGVVFRYERITVSDKQWLHETRVFSH